MSQIFLAILPGHTWLKQGFSRTPTMYKVRLYFVQSMSDSHLMSPLSFIALRWTSWRRQKAKGKLRRRWRSLSRWCLVRSQTASHHEGPTAVGPEWEESIFCYFQHFSVCPFSETISVSKLDGKNSCFCWVHIYTECKPVAGWMEQHTQD